MGVMFRTLKLDGQIFEALPNFLTRGGKLRSRCRMVKIGAEDFGSERRQLPRRQLPASINKQELPATINSCLFPELACLS